MAHHIASDDTQQVHRAGRRPPGVASASAMVPAGTLHAVDDRDLGETVCGRPVVDLHDFPEMGWHEVPRWGAACPVCQGRHVHRVLPTS